MKRKGLLMGIIILVAGAIAMGSILFYAVTVWSTSPRLFENGKKKLGEGLYEKITAVDLDNAYPQKPEEVMDLYMNILRLQYGKIVADDDLMRELITQQRKMYSDTLIAQNPSEIVQYGELMRTTAKMYEQKVLLTVIERSGAVIHPTDPAMCVITVMQSYSSYGIAHWEYYLERAADGRWKIHSWEMIEEITE